MLFFWDLFFEYQDWIFREDLKLFKVPDMIGDRMICENEQTSYKNTHKNVFERQIKANEKLRILRGTPTRNAIWLATVSPLVNNFKQYNTKFYLMITTIFQLKVKQEWNTKIWILLQNNQQQFHIPTHSKLFSGNWQMRKVIKKWSYENVKPTLQ